MMVEAKYTVYYVSLTRCFHYKAWLLDTEKGYRFGPSRSGGGIGPHWFDWNKRSAIRQAKRDARHLLEQYAKEKANRPIFGTVTLDNAPSYTELQGRIAQLEAELDLAH